MSRTTTGVLIAAMLLYGCGTGSWLPWSSSSGESVVPVVPPGATAYRCEDGKSLTVRYVRDTQSAWVIYPGGEYRLDRAASAAGEEYRRGKITLTVKDGDAALAEDGRLRYAACKPASGK